MTHAKLAVMLSQQQVIEDGIEAFLSHRSVAGAEQSEGSVKGAGEPSQRPQVCCLTLLFALIGDGQMHRWAETSSAIQCCMLSEYQV